MAEPARPLLPSEARRDLDALNGAGGLVALALDAETAMEEAERLAVEDAAPLHRDDRRPKVSE